MSLALWVLSPTLEVRARESVSEWVNPQPSRWIPGLQQPFFSLVYKPRLGLTAKCYGGNSIWHWCSRQGSCLWGWNLLLLRQLPLQLRYPFLFSIATYECGTCSFCISIPPTNLHMAKLYDFCWAGLQVLVSDGDLGDCEGGKHIIYLLCHFERK